MTPFQNANFHRHITEDTYLNNIHDKPVTVSHWSVMVVTGSR